MPKFLSILWEKLKSTIRVFIKPWQFLKPFKNYPEYKLMWSMWFVAWVFIILGVITAIAAMMHKNYSLLQTSGVNFGYGLFVALWYLAKYHKLEKPRAEAKKRAYVAIKKAFYVHKVEV